jgi:hypothetical protein
MDFPPSAKDIVTLDEVRKRNEGCRNFLSIEPETPTSMKMEIVGLSTTTLLYISRAWKRVSVGGSANQFLPFAK